MKKRICAILLVLTLAAIPVSKAQERTPLIYDVGEEVYLEETVLLLGADFVLYDRDTGEFTATGPGMTFRTCRDGRWVEMNNVVWVTDVPVREDDGGRLLAPIEPVCAAFGAGLVLRQDGRQEARPGLLPVPDWPDRYSFLDVYWLSRLVYAESHTEDFLTQTAVAEVVLNRVESEMYPDTVKDVIFDCENGVQFSPTAEGTMDNVPTASCLAAARAALSGSQTISDRVLFFVLAGLEDDWVTENRTFEVQMGVTVFYS